MNVFHIFKANYIADTDTKPSRISVVSLLNGDKFVRSYDSANGSNTADQAIYWLVTDYGYTIVGKADSVKSGESYIVVVEKDTLDQRSGK